VIAVVLGGKTGRSRNAQMTRLIGRYLPKASRGRARTLIAKARAPRNVTRKKVVIAKVVKAKPVVLAIATIPTPKPDSKTQKSSRIQSAYDASSSGKDTASADEIRQKLIELAAKSMPMPIGRPIDPIHTGSVSKPKQVAMVGRSSKHRSSWQIQIGATPTKNSAKKLLSKARNKAGTILASTSDYMETVVKGNATLFRARFAGFPSKGSARRACRYLKKRKFACLAIRP
jgi:D-alanyl-D-alanine carboxypeptidase